MSGDEVVISLDNVSHQYHIFKRSSWFSPGNIETVKSLRNISLIVKKGESLAILGKNGSGKTTLLSLIGGSLRPERGKIVTKGSVFTLRGSNPGLIPTISPRRNVIFLSSAYGVSKEKSLNFQLEVEEFCDLGDAFDRPYNTLSSGMAGRVGFGFTTSLDPEILLMDETLGVGDIEFRKKATEKANLFMERGETVLLSTHSLNLAKSMCSRGIVLDGGKLVFEGSSEEAVSFYVESSSGA